MSLYSIVVPVYNSEKSLEILYKRVLCVFENVIHEDFELILVDDYSKDSSYKIIRKLVSEDSRVKGIQLSVNHGQQRAVLCGFHYVSGDFVITMDDDLQHPPEEIPTLIEKMNFSEDIDVVIGAYDSKKHGPVRKFGTWLMNLTSNMIFKKPKGLKLTSFRLMRRFVVDNLNLISISRPTVGPLLVQTNSRIENVTIRHDERAFGKSGYSFSKLCRTFFFNMFTNSDLPLRLVGKIGVLGFCGSIVLIIFYLIRYFVYGTSVTGWTSSIIISLFFGGITLFSLGIVGKYLTNLMTETKKMPLYLIRREDVEIEEKKEKIEL